MKTDGVAAVVTGGASGLGGETARLLARKGARVTIFDLNEEVGSATAREIDGQFLKVDVSDEVAVADALAAAEAAHGVARVLVNCAGVAPAIRIVNKEGRALERAGMKLGDIGLFEVNEAFSSIPVAWLKALGADPARLNVNGGAIALGHPLGASGTKLMATLIHALHASGQKYGLQTMCEGGGVANATIAEAL